MTELPESPDDGLVRPPHVAGEVLPYLQEALAPSDRGRVEAHVAECEPCREQLAFARRLHADVLERDARHLSPDRCVALAEGTLPPISAEESAHVARCSDCSEELAWARTAPAMPEIAEVASPPLAARPTEVEPRRVRLEGRWTAWVFGAALAAAAVFSFLVVKPNVQERGELPPLAMVVALPAPENARGEGPSATPLQEALSAYAARDYARAEAILVREVEARTADADALLFLGSSRLLLGRPSEARDPLRAAARLTRSPRLREEALWQEAQAALLLGRRIEAEDLLRAIDEQGSSRREEARALLARIAEID